MRQQLRLHPDSHSVAVKSIDVEIARPRTGRVELSYIVTGQMRSIRMHAAVGLAGVGRKGLLEQLERLPHPFRSVIYIHDATIACIGAHGGRDGGIVIVGTGSVGFAVVEGREFRIGGYGFPISDEGSGADLGLHARFYLPDPSQA